MTVLFFITTGVYGESPTDKGVYSLGGSISYQNQGGNYGSNMFTFTPSGRYFIFDNIAVGTSLMFQKTSGDLGAKIYGIGPNLRYYLPYEKANPFFEAGYLYLKSDYGGIISEVASHEYYIGAGLDFFISRNVSIEPMAKYSWRKYNDNSFLGSDTDIKTLYIGVGINLFIF